MFEQGAVTYRNDFTHLPDFGTASWRGDRFEDSLRRAIKDYEESR